MVIPHPNLTDTFTQLETYPISAANLKKTTNPNLAKTKKTTNKVRKENLASL